MEEQKLQEFLNSYYKVVEDRYNSLSEEEKRSIDETAGTPTGNALEKLFIEILNRRELGTGMDASDMPERSPYKPFEGPGPGAIITEEDYNKRKKRYNKPVGNQMKTLLKSTKEYPN